MIRQLDTRQPDFAPTLAALLAWNPDQDEGIERTVAWYRSASR